MVVKWLYELMQENEKLRKREGSVWMNEEEEGEITGVGARVLVNEEEERKKLGGTKRVTSLARAHLSENMEGTG